MQHKQVFFTSDLHLQHRLVAHLRGHGSSREDADVDAHDAEIAADWDARVTDADEVWVLGDLTISKLGYALDWIDDRPGVKHLVSGNHDSCLDLTTRAVTQRGILSVDQIRSDDYVLTVGVHGHAIWERPTRVIKIPYRGRMVKVTSQHVDALLTPDHRVVGYQRLKNGSWRWTERKAADIEPLSTLGVVVSGRGKELDCPDLTDDLIRLMAWCHTDSHRVPDRGYWIFYQRESKKGRIESLLTGYDVSARRRVRSISSVAGRDLVNEPEPAWEYYVKDRGLRDVLNQLVPDRDHLGSGVWELSERQVDVLVSEWQYTDGSLTTSGKLGKGSSVVLYCSRTGLRHELMALMTANGWRTSETEYRPGHWRINASKATITRLPRRNGVSSEETDDDVWCLTMPSGQFFVERGGKIHLTGNCHPMHRRWTRTVRKHLEVFETVQPLAAIRLEGKTIQMSHFPFGDSPGADHTYEARYTDWRPVNQGQYLLHGHTHSADQRHHDRQVHVGWDAWRRLVSQHDIARIIRENP